jgi:hypothetical protein
MAKVVNAGWKPAVEAGAATLAAVGAARAVAPKTAAIAVIRMQRRDVGSGISVLTAQM